LMLLDREVRQGYNPAYLCRWWQVQSVLLPEVNQEDICRL
jgi:hypothetical protein